MQFSVKTGHHAVGYESQKYIASGAFRIWQRGRAWRARRTRAYSGGLGRSPQRGPGAKPLVREPGGQSPAEAETLCV